MHRRARPSRLQRFLEGLLTTGPAMQRNYLSSEKNSSSSSRLKRLSSRSRMRARRHRPYTLALIRRYIECSSLFLSTHSFSSQLIRLNEELRQELDIERNISIELRKDLNQLSKEVEPTLRKVSREFLTQDGLPDTKPSPSSPSRRESAAVREELAGLK